MKNKRNQIIITALAIMIAIAGYINYTGSLSDIISIKDKDSVTASNEIDDEYVSGETLDITSTDEDLDIAKRSVKASLLRPHTGQTQSSGTSSHLVPGATPLSGSPRVSS